MGRPNEGKTPPVEHLWPHHSAMARAIALGARPGEIAETFSMSPAHVTRILNSPLFQAEVNRFCAETDIAASDVRADMQLLAKRGVQILSADLEGLANRADDDGRKLKQTMIFGILDRSGYGAKEGVKSVHLHKHLHTEVGQMSDEELMKDVIELSEGDD